MAPRREVWIETKNKEVLTTALEVGLSPTVLFGPHAGTAVTEWRTLGKFNSVYQSPDGSLVDEEGRQVGLVRQLACAEDLRAAEAAAAGHEGVFVMDASDWQVIPAENLVAAFQSSPAGSLLATAASAAGAQTFLEALELGCGVVLRTEDPGEVRRLAAYLATRQAEAAERLHYEAARVTSVTPLGMGDRACVDLAAMLAPGEGLLVGSFARGLFLVHSECAESSYIASRPFRVNAGPVHAYVQRPGGRTGYLSELKSGAEVLVADPGGGQRTALVGRVKIEQRPLMLVEAVTTDGDRISLQLQNAETVKLVGLRAAGAPPAGTAANSSTARKAASAGISASALTPSSSPSSSSGTDPAAVGPVWQAGGASVDAAGGHSSSSSRGPQWQAIPVTVLAPGDQVLVLRQAAARHTGIAVADMSIQER